MRFGLWLAAGIGAMMVLHQVSASGVKAPEQAPIHVPQASAKTAALGLSAHEAGHAVGQAAGDAAHASVTNKLVASSSQAGAQSGMKAGDARTKRADTQARQGEAQAQRAADYLVRAYAASKARPTSLEVHTWSLVNQQFTNLPQLLTLADRVRQEMAQSGTKLTHTKMLKKAVDGEAYVAVEGETAAGGKISIILSSLDAGPASSQTLLVIQTDETVTNLATKPTPEVASGLQKLRNRLAIVWAAEWAGARAVQASTVQAAPQISACISGHRDGRMLNGQEDAVVSRVLGSVSARRVEGIQTGSLLSISAYSPLSSIRLTSDGHKMNLQIGVHYDSYHHYTHVVIGTPIITVTY
ncbi:MAG: YwmB family TATA-box binding protein [Alicyclobacillus herbarius]|uniref:YwmB family TATA-box binding protein n=1 Tax=Alicyclobacillus herbarius TaxID=122960 RepID=UPI0023525FFA|nr:YwmB family TATA-box binding protein [Alicyclobacillus herbarius]MCL6631817.1 YwmB family TATA-box binding protein [Alicyclobacillus herbarius]